MGFGISNKRVSPIAVDFGVDRMKLLQLVQNDPPQMIAAAAVEFPESARKDMVARHEFIAEYLPKLLRDQKFKGRKANISIPAFQTLVQNFEVSKGEDAEIDEQVGMQLRQRMNVNPNRMVIRNLPVPGKSGSKQEVVCLAASRDAVMKYIETANRCKLDVTGMHCEPMAIMQAFAHLYRRESDKERTTCFIDIGAGTTKVIIAHGRELVFARSIQAAGDHFTREIAKANNLDFSEARKLRLEWAKQGGSPTAGRAAHPAVGTVQQSARPTGGVSPIDVTQQSESATATVQPPATPESLVNDSTVQGDALQCLIDELQLCVRYHQRTFPDRVIEKLVFVGGESHHVKNCQRVAKALRIGAQLGDPLARMLRISQGGTPTGVDMRQPQPGWAVPFGLCHSEANIR